MNSETKFYLNDSIIQAMVTLLAVLIPQCIFLFVRIQIEK